MKKIIEITAKYASLIIASFNALMFFAMRICWSGISKTLGYEKNYAKIIFDLPVLVMVLFAVVAVLSIINFLLNKKKPVLSYILFGVSFLFLIVIIAIFILGAMEYSLYIFRNFATSLGYLLLIGIAIFFIFFYHKTPLKDSKPFKISLISIISLASVCSLLKVTINYITYEPVVYAVENEYQIVFSSSSNSMGSVKIGDKEYYDLFSGSEKSFTKIHKVCVPMSELNNAKEYTISVQHPIYRGPFGALLGREITKTYNFIPCDKSDGIKYFTISDVHLNFKRAVQTASYVENMDFLVLGGDLTSYVQNEEDANFANKIAFAITKGEKPVIYTRGNHEIKGEYAEQLYKYVGSKDQKFFYTFYLDGVYGLNLDIGEDHDDDWWEYYTTAHFDEYRNEQLSLLDEELLKQDYLSYDYRLLTCHIPLPFVNYRKNHEDFKSKAVAKLNNMNIDMHVSGHQHQLYVFDPNKVTPNTKLTYNPEFKKGTYNGYLLDFNFPSLMVSKTGFNQKDSNYLVNAKSIIGLETYVDLNNHQQICTYKNSKGEKVNVVNPFAEINYGDSIEIDLLTKEMK